MKEYQYTHADATEKPPDALPDYTPLDVSLSEFLAPFYPDVYEEIRGRTFAPKGAPEDDPRFSALKFGITREGLECDEELLSSLRAVNETRGLYFVVNRGGDKDKLITGYTAFFVESDKATIAEQHARLDACPIQPSIRVETRNSVHAYWLRAGDCSEAEWRDIQRRLIAYFDGDPKIKNPSRVMRLPAFNHVSYDKEAGTFSYKQVEVKEFFPEKRFTVAEMCAAFPPVTESKQGAKADARQTPEQSAGEYKSWIPLHEELARRVIAEAKKNEAGNYEMRCPVHRGESSTSLVHFPATGKTACLKDGCSYGDLLVAFGLPAFPVSTKVYFRSNQTSAGGAPEAENNARASQSDDERDDAGDKLQPTDMGNGYRFARQHRDVARFNGLANKWFLWDTKRWAEDTSGAVMRLAKRTVQNIYHEAAMPTDEEERKALAKHAIKSEADGRLTAMLHQAQSELPVRVEEFDADPFALNCDNGILDLRTGELCPHNRKAMHTKLSPVAYDPAATAPKWMAFLDRIFDGDASLIGFVQKAVGYSLTGDVSEQCLFLLHGSGANGKSVFLKTLTAMLADYGQTTRTETWMTKRPGGVSNDVAALRGARFVSAVETDDGQRLAEGTVKALTGGDAVRARFLFQESFEFQPQFKIWLAANHKPEIRGTDHAIWRRIRLVPFNVTIPALERNAHLDAELRSELPGVLAWAVEGCLAWQREGLGEPLAVKEATADYKDEMDALAEFFVDRCEVGEHYQATAGELFAAYESWCQSNGEPKQSQRWLGLRLKERGFEQSKSKHSRFWKGIGLIRHEN